MKSRLRFLAPLILALLVLIPTPAWAGGYITMGTQETPSGSGSTWQDGSGSYSTGDYIYIHASPYSGYEFDYWEIIDTDTGSSYVNPNADAVVSTYDLADVNLWAIAHFKSASTGHNLEYLPLQKGSCTTNGTRAHYRCVDCGQLFWDSDALSPTTSDQLIIWATGHSWSNWYYPAEPTCVDSGTRYHECTVCHEIESETVSPTGIHSWSSWTTITPATCTSDGVSQRTCTVCGATDTQPIPASGFHSWSSWTTITPATCTSDGVSQRTCTVCGATDTQPVPAIAHSWSSWSTVTSATCTSDGVSQRTCTACGAIDKQPVPATGHSWDSGTVTTAATYDKAGVRTYTCKSCGTTKTESIPKLTCNVVTHSSIPWSCWLEGDGSYEKGTSVTVSCSPVDGYEFVRWVNYNDGSTLSTNRVYTFTVSGNLDVTAVLQKKHEHTWVEVAYKAATCTEAGNAAYAYCSDCGVIVDSPSAMDIYAEVPAIPALGHDFGSWKVTMEPTCTEAGEETSTCTVCGEKQTRAVEALGHDWDGGAVTTEPTETAEGVRTFTCKNDPSHTKTEAIPATGKKGGSDNGGDGNATPTPAPSPEPAQGQGIPLPILAAGAIGAAALGALIVVLAKRRGDKDDDAAGSGPTHMKR